eukprot:724765-Pyramimonas_sp.AAC.1
MENLGGLPGAHVGRVRSLVGRLGVVLARCWIVVGLPGSSQGLVKPLSDPLWAVLEPSCVVLDILCRLVRIAQKFHWRRKISAGGQQIWLGSPGGARKTTTR